jgi:hypothetical protein
MFQTFSLPSKGSNWENNKPIDNGRGNLHSIKGCNKFCPISQGFYSQHNE